MEKYILRREIVVTIKMEEESESIGRKDERKGVVLTEWDTGLLPSAQEVRVSLPCIHV